MIGAAARRFVLVFLVLGVLAVAVGSLLGVVTGDSARRGATLGLYSVGSFCTLIGAGLVIRNSFQLRNQGASSGDEGERPAADRELAGVLLVLGLLLVAVGVAVDPHATLLYIDFRVH